MIEKRLLQRRTLSTRWVASRRSRWQRWAEALAGRWGRALDGAPLGLAFLRGPRPAAAWLALQNRVDVSVALGVTLQLASQRSTHVQHLLARIERQQLSLVRTLLRPPRVERQAGPALPRAAVTAGTRVSARLLQERIEERIERRLVTRVSAPRVLIRPQADIERVSSARIAWREGPALDELPKRLQRRAERRVLDGSFEVSTRLAAPRSATRAAAERPNEALPGPFPSGSPAHDRGRHELMGAVPALNIERITEQVIGRLDRRITAQRERMGRI